VVGSHKVAKKNVLWIYKKSLFVYLLQSMPILYSKIILVLQYNLHNKVENKMYLDDNEEMHINIEVSEK